MDGEEMNAVLGTTKKAANGAQILVVATAGRMDGGVEKTVLGLGGAQTVGGRDGKEAVGRITSRSQGEIHNGMNRRGKRLVGKRRSTKIRGCIPTTAIMMSMKFTA